MGDAVARLFQSKAIDEVLKPLAILGEVNGVRGGAEDRDPGLFQCIGELQRRLPAELHDHAVQRPVGLFDAQDFHNVLKGQRFEIEPVGGVVIGRNRLGVTVDHDRLVPRVSQRETGMTAAIVELDSLADPVWTTAEDHHLLAIRGAGFVLDLAHHRLFVGRIHIGRLGFEFRRTGVDPFEHRRDAEVLSRAAHLILVARGKLREAGIGKTHGLVVTQAVFGDGQAICLDLGLGIDDFADPGEEPGIERGHAVDVVIRKPVPHRLGDHADTVGRLEGQRLGDSGLVRCAFDFDIVETREAGLHRGQRLLQRLVKGPSDRHDLAHGFHRGGEVRLGAGEFLEGEARDLGDNVVDGRFERGRGDAGDVVVEFVQRVTDRQLGRDLGNREARRL